MTLISLQKRGFVAYSDIDRKPSYYLTAQGLRVARALIEADGTNKDSDNG